MNNARILVVEDEALVSMEIKERLIAMGHQVTGIAPSCDKALQCIRDQSPNLILMDIRLKGNTDGITTAETIRREFDLPVIFLTAHSDEETLKRAKLVQPYGYILKPINEHELKSTIEIARYKHRTDRQIFRLNRLYDVLSQVSQAIAYNRSKKELLQTVCRILVERGEVDLAWFDWLDPDALRLSATALFRESDHVTTETEVLPERDFRGGEHVWETLSEGKPLILGTCWGSKCPFSVACTPDLPELESCGHFPLKLRGRVCGVLSFRSREIELFQEREIELLKEIAGDLSFALERMNDETRREQAEELLRGSEERFRNTFEQAAVGMSILTPSGTWLQVNERLCEILGYSHDELMKLNFRDITHPEHLDGDTDRVRQMVAGVRATDSWEKRYVRKDGEVIWALITTSLIRSEDGKPQYFVTVIENITSQVRQREQIILLNRLYSVLSQVSQAVVRVTLLEPFLEESCRIVTEEGGLMLAWIGCVDKETNKVIPTAFSGRAGEYARGISVYADDRPEGRGPTGCSIREGRPFVYNDFLHDELAIPWRERAAGFGIKSAAAFPILSEEGVWGALTVYSDEVDFFSETETRLLEKIAGEIGFAIDHMERKRQREKAEKATEALRSQNELILNSAGEGILGLDSEGRHTFVNLSASNMLGYEVHELIGKTGHGLYHHTKEDGQPYPEAECPVCRTLRSGIVCPLTEEVFWRKDGTSFPVRYSTAPMIDEGKIRGAVVTFRDITQRRRIEEDREKLQAQLYQAQKMEALGTLAGGITHDFNNILAAILGYVEMAQDGAPEGSAQSSDLQEVLRATYRARDLVGHILAFSRQGASQEVRPLSIGSIVKEALKLLRASLPSTIEIRSNIDNQVGAVMGDPTQMHQIVMNLCTNAAHAMRPKGGVLEIGLTALKLDAEAAKTYQDLKEGAHVKLTIEDTGHGMDAATVERIFEPYFTTKEVGEGTGLGLAVVHGIVKRFQGAIRVLSLPGEGTIFEILFPKVESAHEGVRLAQGEIPRGTEHILFVDDEKPLVELVQKLLLSLGYQVTAKTNSLEALELLRSQPDAFDLVISDQTMPRLTGADLAKEIRRIRENIPIILCTGYSETIDEDTAKEIGIRAFVLKPFDRRTIAEIIRKVLDEQAPR